MLQIEDRSVLPDLLKRSEMRALFPENVTVNCLPKSEKNFNEKIKYI
jgi:hypothetical protein